MAIFALGAQVSAQSVTFMSIQANNQEGFDYKIRVVNPTPKDTAKVELAFSQISNFSTKKVLLKYAFKDSIKIITGSLSGAAYSLPIPSPSATIYVMATLSNDSAKWKSVNTGIQTIGLYEMPKKPKASYANKPIATNLGIIVTLSVNCNTGWKLYRYFENRDSNKTISSGWIGVDSFPAMNGTFKDTFYNALSGGWLSYKISGIGGDTTLGIMKGPKYTPNARPWSNITSTKWDGTKWSVTGDLTGNNLATTGTLLYLEPGATKWKAGSTLNFIGQGVENFNYNITSTLQGAWAFKIATKNSMGVDTSSTLTDNNQVPTSAFSITNGAVTYLSPGKIKVTGNLTLSAGNTAKLTTMICNDTLFNVVEMSKEYTFTTSGNIEIIFEGILTKGQKYVTFRGYDTKSNTWIDRVRPYSKVYISNAADVKPVVIKEDVKVYPNPTTTSEGFTINCASNKTETLIMFNSVGQVVYEQTVSNSDIVKPDLPAGLYPYKLGNTTGRILFH